MSVDRHDPNQWTAEFVAGNQAFCMRVLRDTNESVAELVGISQYEAAVSGLDRILNGLITLQNHTSSNYRTQICLLSWAEAEIVAFGVNAPESKRREVSLNLFKDARDYAQHDNTRSRIAAVIQDLEAGIPLETIQRTHDPKFPYSVLNILDQMDRTLVAAPPSSRKSAAPAAAAAPEPESPVLKKWILPACLCLALLILVVFLMSRVLAPSAEVTPVSTLPSSSAEEQEPSDEPTESVPETTQESSAPTEDTQETVSGEGSGEAYVVKTQHGSGLNLREEASTNSKVIKALAEYSVVHILKTDGNWAYVSVGDLTGWCSLDFLVPEGDPSLEDAQTTTATVKTKGNDLRMRAEPSVNSEVIGNIPTGKVVTVLHVEKDWCYVHYNGTKGWCSREYLILEGEEEPEETTTPEDPTEAGEKTATVTTSGGDLRLRSEPSTDSDVIDGIPNGTVVTVLKEEDGWSYVEYKGNKGWCSSDYLKTT